MKKRQYDWILLDLDNTIFDFNTSSKLAFGSLLSDLNLEDKNGHYTTYKSLNKGVWQQLEQGVITADQVKWMRFQKFFDFLGVDKDPHQANTLYLNHLVHHFRFIDGAKEVVDYLSDNYELAVVTNGLQTVQRARLEKSGIADCFSVTIISEEIGYAKPQKDYFDETFRRMGQPDNSRVLMVGDNLSSDIKGGLEYGIDTCWYNPGQEVNNNGFQPKYEIDNIDLLKQLL